MNGQLWHPCDHRRCTSEPCCATCLLCEDHCTCTPDGTTPLPDLAERERVARLVFASWGLTGPGEINSPTLSPSREATVQGGVPVVREQHFQMDRICERPQTVLTRGTPSHVTWQVMVDRRQSAQVPGFQTWTPATARFITDDERAAFLHALAALDGHHVPYSHVPGVAQALREHRARYQSGERFDLVYGDVFDAAAKSAYPAPWPPVAEALRRLYRMVGCHDEPDRTPPAWLLSAAQDHVQRLLRVS